MPCGLLLEVIDDKSSPRAGAKSNKKSKMKDSKLQAWSTKLQWRERVVTLDPSWFTICMGTGIIVQLLASNFPYPAQWLRNLGYAFWVLDVCLFVLFGTMSIARVILYPRVVQEIFDDFTQTSYLGAVPTAWETIVTGLVIFYSDRSPAVYVAEAFFWIAVAMTTLSTCGGVYAMYKRQGQHQLNEVTGAWLLTFIPMIVCAALGSNLVRYLSVNNGGVILVVSYLMVSLGLGMSAIILGIYFWRLMACQLPAQGLIVSCFVPVGPLSMAAYVMENLSVGLAQYITRTQFHFQQSWEPAVSEATNAAVAEMIMWSGILVAMFLLGVGTFFLIEAFAAVLVKLPKKFNIGLWSFVFPCGVYANGFCRMSNLLRNEAMKGWAAACVMGTVLLWLMCAVLTTHKGVLQRKLFFAPGLQGWMEKKETDELHEAMRGNTKDTYQSSSSQASRGNRTLFRRHCHEDGSYDQVAVRDEDKDVGV